MFVMFHAYDEDGQQEMPMVKKFMGIEADRSLNVSGNEKWEIKVLVKDVEYEEIVCEGVEAGTLEPVEVPAFYPVFFGDYATVKKAYSMIMENFAEAVKAKLFRIPRGITIAEDLAIRGE